MHRVKIRDHSKPNYLHVPVPDRTVENSKIKEILSSRQGWLSVKSDEHLGRKNAPEITKLPLTAE